MELKYSSYALILSDEKDFAKYLSRSLEQEGLNVEIKNILGEINLSTPVAYVFILLLNDSPIPESSIAVIKNFVSEVQPKIEIVDSGKNKLNIKNLFPEKELDIRILEIPDMFGPSISLDGGSNIIKYLYELSKNTGISTLPAHEKVGIVYEEDATIAIKKAIFSPQTKSKIFFLENAEKLTPLEISNHLNKRIEFSNTAIHKSANSYIEEFSDFKRSPLPRVESGKDIFNKISKTIDSFSRQAYQVSVDDSPFLSSNVANVNGNETSITPNRTTIDSQVNENETAKEIETVEEHEIANVVPIEKTVPPIVAASPSNINKPRLKDLLESRPKLAARIFKFILLGALIYLISIAILLLLSALFLNNTATSLKNKNIKNINNSLQIASISSKIAVFLIQPLANIPLSPFQQLVNQVRIVDDISQSSYSLSGQIDQLSIFGTSLANSLLSSGTPPSNDYFNQLSNILSIADSDLQRIQQVVLSSKIINLDKYKLQLSEIRSDLSRIRNVAPALGDILGLQGEVNYLVLFQNNAELRPTGGFIGSIGFAKFNQAALVDFQVFDVYSLDGQLRGHVEPPAAIKAYLGEGGWFLRDSNWDPNFSSSAENALWFVDKEVNKQAQGVIAVNMNFVQSLLEITGPIDLPDFNEKISAENLFERAEFQSESAFFPGSTNKKDFLGALARNLLERAKHLDDSDRYKLAFSVNNGFKHKDIMFYSISPLIQSLAQGLDGGVSYKSCISGCFRDYQMVVDANVGVNKVNYFTTRAQEENLIITDEEVSHKLAITYQNNSQTESWPSGKYKNFLRIYIHPDAKIASLKITGANEEALLEYDAASENGFKSLSSLLIIPIGQSRKVVLDYTVPLPKLVNTYQLNVLKQPSTQDNYKIVINSTKDAAHLDFEGVKLTPSHSVSYNTILSQDSSLNVLF